MKILDENLDLKNCIKIQIGEVTLLVDNLEQYNTKMSFDNFILNIGTKYYYYGYEYSRNENKIIEDLEDLGVEVLNLYNVIRERLNDLIVLGLFNYTEKNKNKKLPIQDMLDKYKICRIGENPLKRIQDYFSYKMDWTSLKNGEIVISSLYIDKEWKDLKFNLANKKVYLDDEDYINEEEQADLTLKAFVNQIDIDNYVMYYKYINNKLEGEELAYKEIAELKKWLNGKSKVAVVYEINGLEKESKVKADISKMFWNLSKEYSDEMLELYEINEIKSLKQIKGFRYNKDFYKLNTENLMYKKEEV